MHFSGLYLSIIVVPHEPSVLLPYSHVPKDLLVGLRKARRLISRTYMYTGAYSAGAGLSLACERSHVLLVGKNCSRNSNCQADSVDVVWDSCCITFYTHIHMEANFLV